MTTCNRSLILLSLSTCLLLFVSSCKDETLTPSDEEKMMEEEIEVVTMEPTGTENYIDGDSDHIFDQSVLRTYELWLPEENLQFLDNDPAAEEYVEGTLIFEGDTLSPVGIRYKGSIGAWVNCLSGANVFEPSGRKTCTKLSMKVKINWEGRDEEFYGLKKLQFHSMNLDDSQLHERVGYYLFREMGVPAPRSVHARLMINGEFSGIYALTEQIDGRFTRYNYDDGKGNLYKEIWPLKMNGEPHAESDYIDALKTNEDEDPTAELIRTFAEEVRDAPDAALRSVIEKWMDMDVTMAYVAVDRAIKNDDGAFHWYCSGDDCSPHNFYWYEETSEEKLHLIPWDLDNAFENIISVQNQVTYIEDEWGQTRNNCEPFFAGFFLRQWSAACDKLTRGWTMYVDEYNEKKKELVEGPMAEQNIEAHIDEWVELMRPAVIEAEQTHGDAVSIAQWEASIRELKSQLDYARTQ